MAADHGGFRGYYVRPGGPEETERVLRLALPSDASAVRLARQVTRDALAACDNAAAAAPTPVLPAVGPIRVQVDAALGSLWDR